MDLIFHKTEYEYYTNIDIDGDDSRMILDTGSPVTTISIPSLLQITGEPMFAFRKKADAFMQNYETLSLGSYGSHKDDKNDFIPYLVKDIRIGDIVFPYFMFWVDITYLNSKSPVPTPILFGYDYIKQGKKRFDDDDNFHIAFDEIKADTFSVKYAMSNVCDGINEIKSLVV